MIPSTLLAASTVTFQNQLRAKASSSTRAKENSSTQLKAPPCRQQDTRMSQVMISGARRALRPPVGLPTSLPRVDVHCPTGDRTRSERHPSGTDSNGRTDNGAVNKVLAKTSGGQLQEMRIRGKTTAASRFAGFNSDCRNLPSVFMPFSTCSMLHSVDDHGLRPL